MAAPMIYNNVILKARDSTNIDKLERLLTTQAQVSLTEQGCERFEVYHSLSEPEVFLLIEWWATQQDLDAHRSAPQFVDVYLPKVVPLVERMPHPSKRLV
jgi:quinol monooxygenase YgiN